MPKEFPINPLVPELWCSDFDKSLTFYTDVLGFQVVQRRDQDHHAYIDLEGSQLMLASWEPDGTWEPAPLKHPYGRGINFQILVSDVRKLYNAVKSAGILPFVDLYTQDYWRTDRMDQRTEFAVLDPDGYLLRFSQIESHKPVT